MEWSEFGGDYEIGRSVRLCVRLSVYTSLGGDMHSYERLLVAIYVLVVSNDLHWLCVVGVGCET